MLVNELNNSFEKLKRYFIKKRVSVPITVLVHLLQSFKAWPMDFRKISFRNKKNLSLLTGNVFFLGYIQEWKSSLQRRYVFHRLHAGRKNCLL